MLVIDAEIPLFKPFTFVQRSYPPPEEIATPANAELLIDDVLNPQQLEAQRQV